MGPGAFKLKYPLVFMQKLPMKSTALEFKYIMNGTIEKFNHNKKKYNDFIFIFSQKLPNAQTYKTIFSNDLVFASAQI